MRPDTGWLTNKGMWRVAPLLAVLVTTTIGVTRAPASYARAARAAASDVRAMTAGWTGASPFGDDATAVAVSPAYASDHTAFFGSATNPNAGQPYESAIAALLRSTDGGATWTTAWLRQTPADGSSVHAQIVQIVVSPAFATDRTVFAVWSEGTDGGIVRSTDGGQTFQEADAGLPLSDIRNGAEARGLAISPQYGSDKTIAATLDAGTLSQSYLSTDGGTTWNAVTVVGPGQGYCATTTVTGGGYLTPLGGMKLASYLPAGNADCSNNFDTLYASSADDGRTWTPGGDIQAAVQNATTSNNVDSQHSHLDATSDGTNLIYTDEYGNAVHSSDGGATWQNVLMPVLGSYVPAADATGHPPLALDIPPGGHDIYAVPQWGKGAPHLYHSADGGSTWNQVWVGHGSTVNHEAAVASPSTFFYAAGSSGLFKTADSGTTWQSVGLAHPQMSAVAVSPAYATDNTLFGADFHSSLVTTTNQEGSGFGVFRSDTAGATWHEPEAADLDTGTIWTTAANGVLSLAVSPNYASDHTIFEGDNLGAVHISHDGGATWTTSLISGQEGWNIVALALSPRYATDPVVFAGLNPAGFGIERSSDGGLTWMQDVPQDRIQELGNSGTTDVAVTPDPSGLLDVVIAMGGQLYLMQDDGHSATPPEWVSFTQGLGGGGAGTVAFSPNYATDCTMYVSSHSPAFPTLDDGLYMSANACPANAQAGTVTWTQLKNGLPVRDITKIVLSPTFAADRTMFVSSLTQGVYVSTDAGASWSPFNTGLGNLTVNHLALAATGNQAGMLFAATDDGVWRANVALIPAAPTVTPIPPMATPVPPTSTTAPPAPTNTSAPPPPPANTSVPPPPAATSIPAPPAPPPANTSAPPNAPAVTSTPLQTSSAAPTARAQATSTPAGAGNQVAAPPPTDIPAPPSPQRSTARSTRKPTLPAVTVSVPGGVVTLNSMVMVRTLTLPNATVSITAKLTTTRVSSRKVVQYIRPLVKKAGKKPHIAAHGTQPTCGKGVRGCVAQTVTQRVTTTTALYQTTTRARADRKGQLNARVRLTYVVHKAMQATLTVMVKTPRGTVTSSSSVKVVPSATHTARRKR